MDRKAIIVIICCVAGMLAFNSLINKLYPPIPVPVASTNVPPSIGVASNLAVPADSKQTEVPAPAAPGLPTLATDLEEQFIVLTNNDTRFVFTSHGGGLKEIELLHYRQDVTRGAKKRSLTNGLANLNRHGALPVLAITGDASFTGDGVFTLTQDAGAVRAEKKFSDGLRILKEFRASTNYLLVTTVRFENAGTGRLVLPAQEWAVGTATPMGPLDDGLSVGLMWSDGSRSQTISSPWFANRTLGCFPGTPRSVYQAGQSNVVWAAAQNQFFGLVAMPSVPAQSVVARNLKLPRPSMDELPANSKTPPEPEGYAVSLVYGPVVLEAAQSLERQIVLFTGPKEYRTLSRIADRFQNGVDDVMGFNQFPFYSIGAFFGKLLLLSMNWVNHTFTVGYGLAIIIITVVIKLLFWPLTAASTRSMKRMAAFQPQMNAIREKFKDDPAKMNKKMMEFMRENKVNPMGGCLPMLLQMPVFFGFFSMIRTAIELRGASFLWVADLSKPDTLFYVPGIGFPFNPLPLLMGLTMLWQARLTPASPGMDPVQQKMMKYMPLMFMVFLYNFSAGLTLYWTVQNLLTILQTKLTKSNEPATPAGPATSSALTPASKKKK